MDQDPGSKMCLSMPCGSGIPQEPVQEAVYHLVILLLRKGPWTKELGGVTSGLFLLATL